jgi:hypothetical protein
MQRRSLFGLAATLLAAPAIGIPRVFPPYIEAYLKDEVGRSVIVGATEFVLKRISAASEYENLRELLLEVQERSGPKDFYRRVQLESALARCTQNVVSEAVAVSGAS